MTRLQLKDKNYTACEKTENTEATDNIKHLKLYQHRSEKKHDKVQQRLHVAAAWGSDKCPHHTTHLGLLSSPPASLLSISVRCCCPLTVLRSVTVGNQHRTCVSPRPEQTYLKPVVLQSYNKLSEDKKLHGHEGGRWRHFFLCNLSRMLLWIYTDSSVSLWPCLWPVLRTVYAVSPACISHDVQEQQWCLKQQLGSVGYQQMKDKGFGCH